MTKTRSTKRALLMSGLALLMCVSMLIGSTFAWFTDSVTSSGNIIKSGTLDIEMYWANGTEAPDSANWNDASTGAIFNYDKWEPGYTEVRHIKIENKGSLALKYQLAIAANGEVSDLADVIDVYYLDPAAQVSERSDLTADMRLGTLTEVLDAISTTASGNLEPEQNHTITLVLKMQESAGNEYQNKSIGTDFSVKLTAIQKDFESDSFGNNYDEGLEPETMYLFSGADIHNSTAKSGRFELSEDIRTSESDARYGYGYEYIIRKGADYTLDLNGKTLTHDTVNENASHNAFTYTFVANNAGTKLTINGEGKVYANNSEGYTCAVQGKDGTLITLNGGDFEVDNGIAVWAGAGSHIVINGGSYVNGNATTSHELIYSSGGVIDIYGGFFHNTDGNYTLNVEDRNRATAFINVYGGTYVNFDPSTGGQDPNNIKVADGYMVTSEIQANGDVWYTVVPVPDGYEVVSNADALVSALEAGNNIVLTKNIELNSAITVSETVEIDLNGKNLTVVGMDLQAGATILNGTITSGGHTNLVPHLKVSGGNLVMTDVTVDVNHHLNANSNWTEATGMEIQNATATLNNCNIKIDNPTGAKWVYSYGISMNNSTLTLNGGSITAECEEGTAANGPTNPNAISAMGECTVTLNNVDVDATYYATTVNGHLTVNTTDTSVTSADIVDNRGGSHTLNYIN